MLFCGQLGGVSGRFGSKTADGLPRTEDHYAWFMIKVSGRTGVIARIRTVTALYGVETFRESDHRDLLSFRRE